MQKIAIAKTDTLPRVVEKILESREAEIVLVIPAQAAFGASAADLQLLRREAEAADKRVSIESVDRTLLALAKKNRIEAVHPLFREGPGRAMSLSDIIPLPKKTSSASVGETGRAERTPEKSERGKDRETVPERPPKTVFKKEPEEDIEYGETPRPSRGSFLSRLRSDARRDAEAGTDREADKIPAYRRPSRGKIFSGRMTRIGVLTFAALLFSGLASWGIGNAFGRAEVMISFKKIPWQRQDTISGSKTFSKIDVEKRLLPVEVFRQQKNLARLFPASEHTDVAQKAAGKMVIYNAYSASPQTLVATTRFAAPDGKIFRLDAKTVVPGAQVKNGKITPSSVEAGVTADKPGPDYNLGPIDKLTIPGFRGTPRYAGFYGSFRDPITGGSVGTRAIPTAADIAAAKDKTAQSLRANLENDFLNNRPEEFKIAPGASDIAIKKLSVNTATDQDGNFSVLGEAEFRAIGFRETDLDALLRELVTKEYPGMAFEALKVDYGNVKANFETGQLSFSINARATLAPEFSRDNLQASIGGRTVGEARSAILALPQLMSARISLWPFWLSRLPASPRNVNIAAD